MAARDDHHVRVWWDRRAANPRRDVVDEDFRGGWEALDVRKFLAVVRDMHPKADFLCDAREVEPDVAGPNDIELWRWLDRLDVDVHLSAAHEAGLLCEVVVELVVDELRRAVEDRLSCLTEGIVLVTASADGSDDPAVAEDEHLCADALRRGARGRHDGDQRRRFAALQRVGNSGEDFTVHLRKYSAAMSTMQFAHFVRLGAGDE